MLKKRFIGVITVKNGWVVQSFKYRSYLPIGHPAIIAENLDRWGVDEILVLAIDRTNQSLGPDVELLRELGRLSLSTPLTYGGGICNVEQASVAIRSGAERVCIDQALHGDLDVLSDISMHIGSQALVASLPLGIKAGKVMWYNYITRMQCEDDGTLARLFENKLFSEALVIDWRHEGIPNGFDLNLLIRFPVPGVPLIAFGGLGKTSKIKQALNLPQVSAVCVGNFLNYKEHSVQNYKECLASDALRCPEYQGPEI